MKNQNQRNREKTPEQPIQEAPFVTEAELGACCACPGYQFLKPHQRQEDGKIKIRCFPAKSMVVAQTDIATYEQCQVYAQDRR